MMCPVQPQLPFLGCAVSLCMPLACLLDPLPLLVEIIDGIFCATCGAALSTSHVGSSSRIAPSSPVACKRRIPCCRHLFLQLEHSHMWRQGEACEVRPARGALWYPPCSRRYRQSCAAGACTGRISYTCLHISRLWISVVIFLSVAVLGDENTRAFVGKGPRFEQGQQTVSCCTK